MSLATQRTTVPFADLRRHLDPLRAEIIAAIDATLDRCDFIMGREVRAFEQDMAQSLGVHDACAVGNATTGLAALIRALGIGPGDEVITTVHTAIATAEAITLAGASVVFADIDDQNYNIDPDEIRRRITPKTRAIVPVHLYGQPAPLDAILDIAHRHDIPVIEDGAQAQGARSRGNIVGSIGDAAVFSFFPAKTLGGIGDGGAVTARDPDVLLRARMYSNHGRTEKYIHEFEGTNSRLDSIKAAALRIGLRHLDEWNDARRRAAAIYDENLAGIDRIVTPAVDADCTHVYLNYILRTEARDELRTFLEDNGIGTGLHYPLPLNLQPAYERLDQGEGSFPKAERACREVLSLPMFPGITEDEVRTVCHHIRSYFGG